VVAPDDAHGTVVGVAVGTGRLSAKTLGTMASVASEKIAIFCIVSDRVRKINKEQ